MNIVIFMDCGKQKLSYKPPYDLEVFLYLKINEKNYKKSIAFIE